MIRNNHEITEAIHLLQKNLETCQPVSALGVDNFKQIMIMLEVIGMRRSQYWIDETYLTFPQNLREKFENTEWRTATDAREWLEGKFEIHDLLFPEVPPQTSWSKYFSGTNTRN
jgi:hypothetical protein